MINQKLINAYHFSYIRGKVRATHRNLSTILTLTEALVAVGYKLTGYAFTNNYSLEASITDNNSRPHIQIFDLNYVSNATSLSGSKLEDQTPIVYEDTPETGGAGLS